MVRELFDRNSKLIFHYYPQGVLNFSGHNLTYSHKLSNEFISNDLKKVILDYPLLTNEGPILDFEPHNRYLTYFDEVNLNVYQSLSHQEYHRPVFIIVFSPIYSRSHFIYHEINSFSGFTMYVKSLIEENQLKTLNTFKNKVSITEELDKVKFLFLPWMNTHNKERVLKETINMTLDMNLSEYDTKAFLYIQLNSAKGWFDEKTMLDIKGDIMKSGLSLKTVHFINEIALEKEKLESYNEGQYDAKLGLAKTLIDNGFSSIDVSKFTGLSIDRVRELFNSK